MSKVIARVGRPFADDEELLFRNYTLDRKGYLNTVSFDIDGTTHRWDSIERGDAAFALPIDHDKREIYLVEQFRPNISFRGHALGNILSSRIRAKTARQGPIEGLEVTLPLRSLLSLDAPAGVVETGPTGEAKEPPDWTARRELDEEVGYDISPNRLLPIRWHNPSVGGTTERHYLYYADVTGIERHEAKGDGNERLAIHAFGFDEVEPLLRSDRITSGSCIILLQDFLLRRLGKKNRILRDRLKNDPL